MDREVAGCKDRETDRQTDKRTDRVIDRYMNKQTHAQEDRYAGRQTDGTLHLSRALHQGSSTSSLLALGSMLGCFHSYLVVRKIDL